MNNKTKKAIKEEIKVVKKQYPNKSAKSVLYLAIRHVIRRENPEIDGRERYNLQKELFNEMEENNMKELDFNQIKDKSFSIVGIRHYTGINKIVEEGKGRLVIENNNIVLKTNNGDMVGSMLSSDTKMSELIELGVPKNALTQQKTFKIKNISKNVFDNVKVTVEQHIHNECVVVKVVEKIAKKEEKGDEKMLRDINIRVEEAGEPQYAIGSNKIIGYDEVEVCGECGTIIHSKDHKYCTECGAKIREEVSSSQNNNEDEDEDDIMVEIPKDIKSITVEKAIKKEVNIMALNMSLDSLNESFEKAVAEYTLDMAKAINEVDGDSISLILQSFRKLDDIIAKKYLNDEITGGEFDHVRAWITIQGYFFYNYNIKEITKNEFFTADSMLASEKFLKEEEEASSSFKDEDDEQEMCIISDKKEKCTQCDYCITSGNTDCVKEHTEQEECDMCRICLN